jgi:hypothetical protein
LATRTRLSVISVLLTTIVTAPFLVSAGADAQVDLGEMPARATLGTPFRLAVNETVAVAGSDISVKFFNVTEDSRCPADVVCVWEGQVTAMVGLTQNSTDLGRFNLTLGGGGNASMAGQSVGAYTIKLTEVQPYPISSQPTLPSDYNATFVLTGSGTGAMARSALVKAVGNSTGSGVSGFIASWSVDREAGVAIIWMQSEDGSFSRAVARFTPFEAECSGDEMAECVDGDVTSVSGDAGISQNDTIHFEIDADKTVVSVTIGSDESELEIRKYKEVSKPIAV